MYNASSELLTAIKQPYRIVSCQVNVGEYINLTDAEIISVDLESNLCPTAEFEIGIAPMSTATIDIKWSEDTNYNYESQVADILFGLELPDETVEYVPMGKYTVEKATVSKRNLTLELVDNMHKADKDFVDNITYPTTPLDILTAVCTQSGLVLATSSFVNSDLVINHEVSFHNISCRTIIAQIAELAGGWAIINRSGELEIITLGSVSQREITDDQYFELNVDEVANSHIDKVVVNVGEESASAGTGGDIYHVVNNMFVNNPALVTQSLYNVLNGTRYLAGSLSWQGDFTLDLGDRVTVESDPFYILNRNLIYGGGISERTDSLAVSNLLKDTRLKGPLTLAIGETRTALRLMDGQISSTVERLDTNSSKLANLTVTVENVKTEVSALGGGNIISNILGTFDVYDWTFDANPWEFKSVSPYGDFNQGLLFMDTDSQIMYPVATDTLSESGFKIFTTGKALSQFARADGGGQYSLYTRYKGTGSVTFKLREYDSTTPSNKSNYQKETAFAITQSTGTWASLNSTITLRATTNTVLLVVESNVNVHNKDYLIWTDSSVNMGQPRPYSESLSDINTKVNYAVTTAETTAGGFSVVSNKMTMVEGRMSDAESSINVQAGQIATKVSRDGVISSINQTPESITIAANRLNLSGYVTVSSVGSGGSTTIHGSRIATGTVDASKIIAGSITASQIGTNAVTAVKISAGAVSADKIATGAITAAKINVTNLASVSSDLGSITGGSINIGSGKFVVSTAGAVTATSITATGKITANSDSSLSGALNSTSGTHSGALYYTSGRHSGTHYGYMESSSGKIGQVSYYSGTEVGGRLILGGGFQATSITTNLYGTTYGDIRGGTFTGDNFVTRTSDIYYKEKLHQNNAKQISSEIYDLDIVEFTHKASQKEDIGVIANEMITKQPILAKHVVHVNEEHRFGVDYTKINTASLYAIQDLNERLKKLEAKL